MRERLLDRIRRGTPTVHFSIDDGILGLQEAFSGSYSSLFDSDYFGFLKGLHEETGVETTSFLFYENSTLERVTEHFDLSMTDERYKSDFTTNSGWMKFGIHAKNRQTPMTSQTSEQVGDTVRMLRDGILGMGYSGNMATSWRPHFFSADRDACDIVGQYADVLLTPDDRRKIVACLSPQVVKRMWGEGTYEDKESGFLLFRTALRVEDQKMSVEDLKAKVDEEIENHGVCSVYTHEYMLVNDNPLSKETREKTIELLKHINERGYSFIS